jgi:hypothetical protein
MTKATDVCNVAAESYKQVSGKAALSKLAKLDPIIIKPQRHLEDICTQLLT